MITWQTYCKQNVALAIPIFLSSCSVMLCSIGSAKIVSFHVTENWYLLGLFLPISYIILGILESGRVCSLRSSATLHHSKDLISTLWRFVWIHAGLIGLLLIILSVLFLFGLDRNYVPRKLHDEFFHFSICYAASYLFISINSIFNAALFGLGKNKTAMLLIICVSIIFLLLTLFFYTMTPMGIYALVNSTIISYALGSYCAWRFVKISMAKNSSVLVDCGWQEAKSLMLSSGLPVFLAYLVMPCALLAFNKLLQPFGDSAVSAFCIAYRLQIIFMLPSLSLGIAAGILSNRASLVHKPYYKLNAIILSVMLSVPLMFLLFLFSNKLSSFFSTSIFIQENIQLYFHYITLGYVGLLPFVTLIALWEQTGFALQGLLINGIVLFCQVLAGIIAMHEHSLNLFYVLSVSVMLVITLLTLMISFFRTRRHLLCIALTI